MNHQNMLQFDILTIFPDVFKGYLKESIIKRAQEKELVKVQVHNLRDWTTDKHKQVDDRPYGGGPGMVLKVEPIYRAIKDIKLKSKKSLVVLLSARGKTFDQKMAQRFSRLNQLILICGRYEGVDERVAKYIADLEVSIGNYILTGGELPAMVIVDATTRLIPGVLGNLESLEEKRLKKLLKNNLSGYPVTHLPGYPVYTRPPVFSPDRKQKWSVPKVLLSGNHQLIDEWRKKKILQYLKKWIPG